MCTSYYLKENSRSLRSVVNAAAHHPLRTRFAGRIAQPVITEGEVTPGDIAPVIAPDAKGVGRVYPMVWGFTGKHSLISELDIDLMDQTRNPILLHAWESCRCLIPSSWYFEWERLHPTISYDSFGDQRPENERREMYINNGPEPDGSDPLGDRYMIQTQGSTVTLLAGIYRMEEVGGTRVPHFLILMQYAAEDIMFIHNKMPVIFPSSDSALLHDWLDPNAMPPWDVNRVINQATKDVVFEKSPRTMSRKRRA